MPLPTIQRKTKSLESKPNGLKLSSIHPRHGGKFSPRLYRWLNKHKGTAQYATAWKDKDNTLWLGWYDDTNCFIGQRLMQILCDSGALNGAWSGQLGKLTEIPNFWQEYLKVGRCAIDPEHQEHFQSDEPRYTGTDKKRKCSWCGLTQQKETYIIKVEKTRWV